MKEETQYACESYAGISSQLSYINAKERDSIRMDACIGRKTK